MKILVVDDEPNIRQLLEYNLKLDGHEVLLAGDGAEALEKVVSDLDLILLDVMMPIMDGLETCSKLKTNPKTKDIPVFMLTAKSQMKDIEGAFSLGADGYLTKPFDPATLNTRLIKKLSNLKRPKS